MNPNKPKRTIDERIDALTHTVELLAQMHQNNEKRYVEMFAQIDRRTERQEKEWERFRAMRAGLGEFFDNDDDSENGDGEGNGGQQ